MSIGGGEEAVGSDSLFISDESKEPSDEDTSMRARGGQRSFDGDAELAKLLKMKEYGVKKSREQARAIGCERLKIYVACIYSVLADVKSGLLTPQSALQNFNNKIFFA